MGDAGGADGLFSWPLEAFDLVEADGSSSVPSGSDDSPLPDEPLSPNWVEHCCFLASINLGAFVFGESPLS